MKFLKGYLFVGLLLTIAWDFQVKGVCGHHLSFAGMVLGPTFMPVFAPFVIWIDEKPRCDRMKLAAP